MTEAEDPWCGTAHRYPDVVAAGGASRGWQAAFDEPVAPEGITRGRQRSALVTRGDRSAALLLSAWQRQFRLSLRAGR
ncbi:hypothetical protein [Actinoplanes awajinensis]|uniref:Uncharacterized protein n=1 Tax=Actinoplanes awajinensis subsp. mycoplanecinus TaxID=135947 RepID=A0A117MKW1_9ACTN|nr:hypothetical protein [Actinoplanes awajinensis]KUL22972.1 hypothetical protein ADL15_47015 [Actinoplanes awajinensis subsp. mycoplanecinus]